LIEATACPKFIDGGQSTAMWMSCNYQLMIDTRGLTRKESMQGKTARVLMLLNMLVIILASAGCGSVSVEPLMPTPVLFTTGDFAPLDHIPEHERWIPRLVYYATDRARTPNVQEIAYGNTPSDDVSVGIALVGFGGPSMTWSDLDRKSRMKERDEVVDLSIAGILETGRFAAGASPAEAAGPQAAGWLLEDLNDTIADSRDKDLLIYIHGARVNFYNACAFAAQFDHFMGRDMTSIAFSWPTRQTILTYAFGSDPQRGYVSAEALATLIELLAAETDARKIHLLAWSAGARVLTRAFRILRERHPDESLESIGERLRIGTAYFAAGDVQTDDFIADLPTINALANRIVVTITSNDEALAASRRIMGGGARIGEQAQQLTEEQRELILRKDQLEVVDVSRESENRGFDITGHRYWFNHPWASTDVLLAIRTDLEPEERGLAQGDSPVEWYVPANYPQRLNDALDRLAFKRSWGEYND
jgi:esterase/lipase superfamily enzyme